MHTAIIGAGAAGLSAAWELVNAGQQVTLIEASDQVGGLASGFQLPSWDWPLEKFYHHWFATDTDILQLIGRIGCDSKITFHRPQSKYWIAGRLYDLSHPLKVLGLPISFIGKLRMAVTGAYLKLPHRWQSLDHVSAYDWLHKTMGAEVYQAFWSTILDSKFKETTREIPLSWVWAHIYNRSAEIAVYEGGFQALWEDFAAVLRKRDVRILLNTPIERLDIQGDRPALCIRGETHAFDGIISTLSPQAMLTITPILANTDYARQVAALKSVGAVCLVLALKQPLFPDGTYGVNLPSDTVVQNGFPFINVFEHTNLVSNRWYGGDHLVYCVDYLMDSQALSQRNDGQIMTDFTHALSRLNPFFANSWIREWRVFRTAAGQPIPRLNDGKHLPALKTPLPGVYWVTVNQMHPWGKGTNFAVRLGRQAAEMLLHDTGKQ